MPTSLNRRAWLQHAGLLATTGLVAGPSTLFAAKPTNTTPTSTPDVIRLHSNENPLGPAPSARKAMEAAFDEGCWYPSEHYGVLENLIAEREGVPRDHVFLAAGSHEVLRMAGMAYGIGQGEVVAGYPTYERMGTYAESAGAHVHRVPLTDDFQLDLPAMARRTTNNVRLVFICNPNNPTGSLIPADQLRAFCTEVSQDAVVLVDEAYHEYVDHPQYASMLDLVKAGHNVIISRTFSKIYGLAGLRIGYGIARPDLAQRMVAFRTAHTVNILGLRAAIASYQDDAFLTESVRENARARQHLCTVLDDLGYRYLPSQTNYVFFHLGRPVQGFTDEMAQRGIRVGRAFAPYHDWCRISIGTYEEMQAFGEALRTVTTP